MIRDSVRGAAVTSWDASHVDDVGMLARPEHNRRTNGRGETLRPSQASLEPCVASRSSICASEYGLNGTLQKICPGLPAIVCAIFQPILPVIAAVMSTLLGIEPWSTGRSERQKVAELAATLSVPEHVSPRQSNLHLCLHHGCDNRHSFWT